MKKWLLTVLVVTGLSLILVTLPLTSCAQPAPTPTPTPAPPAEAEFTLHYECIFPENDGTWFITSQMWKEQIEQRTNGRVEFVLHPANSIVPDYELLDGVRQGVLDAGMGLHGWDQALVGDVAYLGIPGTFLDFTGSYWLTYYGDPPLIDLLREGYAKHNLYYMAPNPDGSTWIFTNFEFSKIDDFKGKKIMASGFPGDWITKFGATPVDIPFEEMYMAMQLGTVDGLFWTALELETAGWGEVAKYALTPAVEDPTAVSLFFNLDSWNALPQDLKDILNKWGQDQFWDVGLAYYNFELENIELAKAHYGTEWIVLSPEEMAIARDYKAQVFDEYAAKDPLFAIGWEQIKNYVPLDKKW